MSRRRQFNMTLNIFYLLLASQLFQCMNAAYLSEEYSKGIKVSNVPMDAASLTSSLTYSDKLYVTHQHKLLVIDKSSGVHLTKLSLKDYGIEEEVEYVTVGPCSNVKGSDNCIYMTAASTQALQIYRMPEPNFQSLVQRKTSNMTVLKLSPHTNSHPKLLVDKKANSWILYGDKKPYKILKISPSDWSTELIPSLTELNLQQDMHIVSLDWDINGDILVMTDEGVPYIFKNEAEVEDVSAILQGKPIKFDLHLSGSHNILSVCWDQHDSSLYCLTQEKHRSIFKFLKAQADHHSGYGEPDSDECRDRNRHCGTWASNGLCLRRKDYMIQNCAQSCEACHENMRMKHLPNCVDGNQLCSVWAGQGYCKGQSQEYMMQNCKKSCNTCLGSESGANTCQDIHRYCTSWASIGRCKTRPDYMMINCPASCNKCPINNLQNDQGSVYSPSNNACKDSSEYCGAWEKSGKCESRRDFMYVSCPYSCGLCGSKSVSTDTEELQKEAQCEDGSKFCMVWAANGFCNAKKVYMMMNCKASCGACRRKPDVEVAQGTCDDQYKDCSIWAKYSVCAMEEAFMNEYCPRSCEKCDRVRDSDMANRILKEGGSPESHDPMTSDCRDKSEHCKVWAENGYCERRGDYMSENCRLSCNMCDIQRESQTTATQSLPQTTTTTTTTIIATTEATTTVYPSSCRDQRQSCTAWKGAGFCSARAKTMAKYCPRTCDLCEGVPETTYTTQHATTSFRAYTKPTDECRDKNDLCPIWSAAGRCSSREGFMRSNCPFSCRFCDGKALTDSEKICEDRNTLCKSWATGDRCHQYKGYMEANCAKTCKFCGNNQQEVTSSPQTREDDCTDTHSYCSIWAEKGFCQIRKVFMSAKCAKSCNLCT